MKIRHVVMALALISAAPMAFADLSCRTDSFGTMRCN